MNTSHQPVLYKEIIHALQPDRGGRYIDGTVGAGGHARSILEACAPDGFLLGLDLDPQALELARKTLAPYEPRFKLAQASFSSILEQMKILGWLSVEGILLDLGVSSMQFDTSSRGFSFQADGPLDMRFTPMLSTTAEILVNSLTQVELADLIYRYGEDPHSRRIAKAIMNARPLHTTRELARIVEAAVPSRGATHPATRTFQALRIAVNSELAVLESSLPIALSALKSGGRLAIISFHSLEDRIVKDFFRAQSKPLINPPYHQIYPEERPATLKEVTRKPIRPSQLELRENPRARSARLRVAEKIL